MYKGFYRVSLEGYVLYKGSFLVVLLLLSRVLRIGVVLYVRVPFRVQG